jgi:CHAT domain-containing protein
MAGNSGIIFLGTHAEMDPARPMYSRLVLSKEGDGMNPDGYLHAYELYELDLRAQLAVLTACESGSGRFDVGEGIRSLGASFGYAGCPSLVVALWNIDEKVSAAIIGQFYYYLAQGLPKHEALRKAKLDHLAKAQDELVHPYYWAGLVLIGDVAPVQLDRPGMAGMVVGLLVLLGVLGVAIVVYRRRIRPRT